MAIEQRTNQVLTIEELQRQIDESKDNAVIHLAPGRIRGRLIIDKPITLRGSGADRTIIDGLGKGPTLSIDADHGEVRIEELGITGGRGLNGGGISIDNGAEVYVVGCLLDRNAAKTGRGGAIAIDRGLLHLIECTIVQNKAVQGGAIFVGGDAKCEVSACIVAENSALSGGGLSVVDGAEVEVWTCRIESNQAEVEGNHIFTYGTTVRRPRIVLSNALLGVVSGGNLPIANNPKFKADLVVDNSTLGREIMAFHVVG